MNSAGHARQVEGFSLVEVLASLVVVGMIGMMIVEGVSTGGRVWERLDTREVRGEILDSAQSALRDRIEQIYPSTLYDKTPPYIDFAGHADRIAFLANPPESERPGPLRRYTLSLDGKSRLVLSSISDVAAHGTAPTPRVLLEGVRRFDIAYFGAVPPDTLRGWREDWAGQSALPDAIRVRVEFEPGDVRRWPDLIIRTRTNIDTSCVLDSITHHCKGRV